MSILLDEAEYLYKEEVAKVLKISESTLKLKIRAKEVPLPIRLKSKNIWKKSEIEEYIERAKKE